MEALDLLEAYGRKRARGETPLEFAQSLGNHPADILRSSRLRGRSHRLGVGGEVWHSPRLLDRPEIHVIDINYIDCQCNCRPSGVPVGEIFQICGLQISNSLNICLAGVRHGCRWTRADRTRHPCQSHDQGRLFFPRQETAQDGEVRGLILSCPGSFYVTSRGK